MKSKKKVFAILAMLIITIFSITPAHASSSESLLYETSTPSDSKNLIESWGYIYDSDTQELSEASNLEIATRGLADSVIMFNYYDLGDFTYEVEMVVQVNDLSDWLLSHTLSISVPGSGETIPPSTGYHSFAKPRVFDLIQFHYPAFFESRDVVVSCSLTFFESGYVTLPTHTLRNPISI